MVLQILAWVRAKMLCYRFMKFHCLNTAAVKSSHWRRPLSAWGNNSGEFCLTVHDTTSAICTYRQTFNIRRTRSQHLNVSRLVLQFFPIHWRQALCREWRCRCCSADRRCSNNTWLINDFIAYEGATYLSVLTVHFNFGDRRPFPITRCLTKTIVKHLISSTRSCLYG